MEIFIWFIKFINFILAIINFNWLISTKLLIYLHHYFQFSFMFLFPVILNLPCTLMVPKMQSLISSQPSPFIKLLLYNLTDRFSDSFRYFTHPSEYLETSVFIVPLLPPFKLISLTRWSHQNSLFRFTLLYLYFVYFLISFF